MEYYFGAFLFVFLNFPFLLGNAEYSPIHYVPGWSSRVEQDDSGSGGGEMNTQHLNQRHEDALSLTNSLQSDV